jgi:hypothetical protein
MKKTIDTLLDDIDALFTGNHKVNEDNLKLFSEALSQVIKTQLERKPEPSTLRMSVLGTKDRKLYFDLKDQTLSQANPRLQQQFLFGHVVEALLLFLAREAGHLVENEQLEVEFMGVPGHLDCTIDKVLVDAKSVSQYMFPKFMNKGVFKENDSFGYITQLAGYFNAVKSRIKDLDQDRVGILAQNKSDARKSLLLFDEFELPSVEERIKAVKVLLKDPNPPLELCYQPVPKGKSGNEALAAGCKFCKHKFKCFDKLRVFNYSTGPEFLTKVVETPSVEEVTEFYGKEEVIAEDPI